MKTMVNRLVAVSAMVLALVFGAVGAAPTSSRDAFPFDHYNVALIETIVDRFGVTSIPDEALTREFVVETGQCGVRFFSDAVHPFDTSTVKRLSLFPSWEKVQVVLPTSVDVAVLDEIEPFIARTEAPVVEQVALQDDSKPAVSAGLEEQVGPKEFWLGESIYAPFSQAAVNAGGIVEWDTNYYASHDYDQGATFKQFEPGCIVHIDGRDILIEDCVYVNRFEMSYGDLREIVSWDKTCFQTCVGYDGTVVVYYGYPL